MEYICQLKNGRMLTRDHTGVYSVEYTGYPYPDTPKTNAEMIQDLVCETSGVLKDIEYYQSNFSKLRDYILDCHKERFDITVSGMMGALNIFNDNIFENACVYQFIEYEGYLGLLVDKIENDRYDRACMSLLFISTELFNKYNVEVRFDSSVFDELGHMFKGSNLCSRVFDNTDCLIEFLQLCIELVKNFKHSYFSVAYSIDSFTDLVLQVLSNIQVMTNYTQETTLALLLQHFSVSGTFFESIDMPQLKQILNISGTNVKTHLGLLDVTDIANLLSYTIVSKFSNINESDSLYNFFERYLKHVLNMFYTTLTEYIMYDNNKFIIDLTGRGNVEEWGIDNLYEAFEEFKDSICSFAYDLEPTSVTSNRIEWDMSKFFAEDLINLVPLICPKFACGAATYTTIDSLNKDEVQELLYETHGMDARSVVFDAEIYKDLVHRFTCYKGNRVFDKLTTDVLNTLGEFNLFAKYFCCDENSWLFKCKYQDVLYTHEAKFVYELGFQHTDMRFKMTKETFEKYVKGAVILDFIKLLFNRCYGDTASLETYAPISLKNIKVFFFPSRQYVKLVYDLRNSDN